MTDFPRLTEHASPDLVLGGEPGGVAYRHQTYVPLVGSLFDIHRRDGDPVSVELVSTTELGGRGECFSLVFRGPAGPPLDQHTYRVEHPALGEFPLFLVPLGPCARGGQDVEAIINRPEG